MKEDRVKCGIYLPQEVYIEIHKRQLTNHISYLVSRLLEEFLRTGVRITWEEIPTKAKQREYLEAKLQEFFSRNGLSSEPSKPSVQERTESIHMQERPKDNYSATKPEPVKEEQTAPPGGDKWWESFW
jgi:hypothetical protein